MRQIVKRDTKPEVAVRRVLHALGYRFRIHRSDLPGTPDIVLPKYRVAILVHGCFWHQHHGCKLARQPKSRLEYWLPKFERNQQRDLEVCDALRASGWVPIVIWECETKSAVRLRQRIADLIPVEPNRGRHVVQSHQVPNLYPDEGREVPRD